MNTEEKKELVKKLNISLKTFYNWEKEKPYLIKLIELGLKKEEELNTTEKSKDVITEIMERLEKLQNEVNELKK